MHAIPGEIKESWSGETRTLDISGLTLSSPRKVKPRKLDEGENIETGMSDGSGTISVEAPREIKQITARSVQLSRVIIEVTGDRAKGTDYSIIDEAAEMIDRDFLW